MIYSGKIHLTNMCMIYDENGNILVQERIKNDWPGINFPGGHVETDESLEESCIREMKEETGLDVFDLEGCGFFEWNNIDTKERHIAVLYRTNKYVGNIINSKEGKVFWINYKDINEYCLSQDFEKIMIECMKGLNICNIKK